MNPNLTSDSNANLTQSSGENLPHNPDADKAISQAYEAAADFLKELELEG